MFYATPENKRRAFDGLRTADVLLTTPHMLGYQLGFPRRMLRKM